MARGGCYKAGELLLHIPSATPHHKIYHSAVDMPVTTRRAKALNSALDTHHGQGIPDNPDSLSQFSGTPSHAAPDEDSDWEPTGWS